MAPSSTFQTYLPSLRSDFQLRSIPNHFAAALSDPELRLNKKGLLRLYHRDRPLSASRRLAFTAHFLPHIVPALLASKPLLRLDPHRLIASHLACKVGIYFCLRKSEFMPAGSSRHSSSPPRGIALRDVVFLRADGSPIPLSSLHPGSSATVSLVIRYSKTDQHGLSRPRTLTRAEPPSPDCIVRELEAWVVTLLRDYGADPSVDHLFSVTSRTFLTSDDLAAVIKATVLHCGLPPERYSPHSLRYGGATMLASAGIPLYLIEYHGGWAPNSRSLRIYLQIGSEVTERQITDVFRAAERSDSLASVRQRHHLLTLPPSLPRPSLPSRSPRLSPRI